MATPRSRLQQYEHQLCHAASAYYTSDFDRALILTLDGGNAGRCGQISLGEGDEIRPLRTMQFPDSLGWFYSRITALLGLRPALGRTQSPVARPRRASPNISPSFANYFAPTRTVSPFSIAAISPPAPTNAARSRRSFSAR